MSHTYNLEHTKCLEKSFISPRNYYSNQALLCRNSHLDIFGSVYVYMQVLWAVSLCAVCTLTIRRVCQFKDSIIYFFDVRSLSRTYQILQIRHFLQGNIQAPAKAASLFYVDKILDFFDPSPLLQIFYFSKIGIFLTPLPLGCLRRIRTAPMYI